MTSIDAQLIEAVSNSRDINIIKKLILDGANVNYVPRSPGQTPLLIASMYGLMDVCKLLLKNGANVNYQTSPRKFPLQRLVITARGVVSKLSAAGYTALIVSISVHIDIMKLLLEYGADVEAVNGEALKFAQKRKKIEHIELLEEHIFQKKLGIVQKRLALSKLFYSDLGKNLVEEGLYEKIGLLI